MRRFALLAAVCGLILAGLGCQHVGGKCDCTYHADDAHAYQPANPYTIVGGEKAAK